MGSKDSEGKKDLPEPGYYYWDGKSHIKIENLKKLDEFELASIAEKLIYGSGEKSESEKQKLASTINSLENRFNFLKQRIDAFYSFNKVINQKLEILSAKQAELDSLISNLLGEWKATIKKLDKIERELHNNKAEHIENRNIMRAIEGQINDLIIIRNFLDSVTKTMSEYDMSQAELRKMVDSLGNSEESLRNELLHVKEGLLSLMERFDTMKKISDSREDETIKKISDVSVQISELRRQFNSNLLDFRHYRKELDGFKVEIKNLKTRIDEYRSSVNELHTDMQSFMDRLNYLEQDRIINLEKSVSDNKNGIKSIYDQLRDISDRLVRIESSNGFRRYESLSRDINKLYNELNLLRKAVK